MRYIYNYGTNTREKMFGCEDPNLSKIERDSPFQLPITDKNLYNTKGVNLLKMLIRCEPNNNTFGKKKCSDFFTGILNGAKPKSLVKL